MWGPNDKSIAKALQFEGAPYAPFSKGDKLGKVADWALDPVKEAKEQKRAQGRGFRDPYHAYGASASSFFTSEDPESSWSFSVVDSMRPSAAGFGAKPQAGATASGKPAVLRARGGFGANNRAGGSASNGGANAASSAPPGSAGAGSSGSSTAAVASAQAAAGGANRGPQQNRGPRTMTIGSATLHNRRGAGGRPGHWAGDKSRVRKPSVQIGANWSHIQTNSISELQKLSFDVPTGNTIGEYGYVQLFDRRMDKLPAAQRLRRVDVTEYNVSTSEDPVIRELASSPEAGAALRVYATDAIVALLMCAPKSNNPWDVIVTKRNGEIYFDKRENSALDLPSVDENALNPPADVTDNKIDSGSALALEASYINLNFAANVVLPEAENRVSLEKPNPFSSGDEPANAPLLPKAYVYKQFNLELDSEKPRVPLTVRMEIDAAVERNGEKELATVYALNEYGGVGKQLVWKDKFNVQPGAIVAAEMKKNLNKLSQWTARSLLAGVNSMKIGFVARVHAKDNQTHEIVSVLNQNPVAFAQQLGLNLRNGWGIIKSLVDVFAALEDGTYVLLRDPNMPSVSIYGVPEGTVFE